MQYVKSTCSGPFHDITFPSVNLGQTFAFVKDMLYIPQLVMALFSTGNPYKVL